VNHFERKGFKISVVGLRQETQENNKEKEGRTEKKARAARERKGERKERKQGR